MQIPKTFTIGQVASALSAMGAIFGLLGWFFALYFNGLQNTKDISTVAVTGDVRSREVDEKFSQIQDRVEDLNVSVAEVKTELKNSKEDQTKSVAMISQKISEVQMDVRNLTSVLLREKMAYSDSYTDLSKVNYHPPQGY